MEESASWKGHSFTLLVFGGIVVLCSIFFVLGMLVGRSQGQRMAELAAAESLEKTPPAEPLADTTDFTFYENVETGEVGPELVIEPRPAAPAPEVIRPAAPAPPPAVASKPPETVKPSGQRFYLQITAVRQLADAEKKLQEVKSKGFSALIVSPADASDPWYRVQVGPYGSMEETNAGKRKLASAGYKDALVKR